MSLYDALELTLLGVLVLNMFGIPQPVGKFGGAVVWVLMLVLAVVGRHA